MFSLTIGIAGKRCRCSLYVGPLALFLAMRQYLQAQEIVVRSIAAYEFQ